LNRIEAQFTALRYFALDGTDHRTHAGARRGHRRVHPLAQCPRRTQTQLRPQVSDPHLDQLPEQRCMTGH
jgi:hypothetical protein